MPGSVFKMELIQGPYLCDMCGRKKDLPGPIWRLRRQNGSPVQKRLVGIGIAEISEEVTMFFSPWGNVYGAWGTLARAAFNSRT